MEPDRSGGIPLCTLTLVPLTLVPLTACVYAVETVFIAGEGLNTKNRTRPPSLSTAEMLQATFHCFQPAQFPRAMPISDKHRPRNLQRHILCISPSNAPPDIARSKRKRRPPERKCILADRDPEKAVLFAVGSEISSDDFALRINRKDLGFARVGEVNGLEDTFA